MLRRIALLLAAAGVVASTTSATAAAPNAPLVQPGREYSFGGVICSFAFLMTGSDGREYAMTAGHCPLRNSYGTKHYGANGEPVFDAAGRQIGRFAYGSFRGSILGSDDRTAVDLAAIRLERGLRGNPAMCGWGGPTGMLTAAVTTPTRVNHSGRGIYLSSALPVRTGAATSLPRVNRLHLVAAMVFGDSGSGSTTSDGLAVGIASTIAPQNSAVGPEPALGTIDLQRFDLAVQAVERALGIRLTLRTAPLRAEPDLGECRPSNVRP